MDDIEIFKLGASSNVIVCNHKLKRYVVVDVKYRLATCIEEILDKPIRTMYRDVKEFKKYHKGYR